MLVSRDRDRLQFPVHSKLTPCAACSIQSIRPGARHPHARLPLRHRHGTKLRKDPRRWKSFKLSALIAAREVKLGGGSRVGGVGSVLYGVGGVDAARGPKPPASARLDCFLPFMCLVSRASCYMIFFESSCSLSSLGASGKNRENRSNHEPRLSIARVESKRRSSNSNSTAIIARVDES